MTTNSRVGSAKNTTRMAASGPTCSHDTACGGSLNRARLRRDASPPRLRRGASRRDELVPAPGQIAVLVHHRVPHRDIAHALPERAAVAHAAGLLHHLAVRIDDVGGGRLAVVPIIPLGR